MIRLFLRFLTLLGVTPDRLVFRLSIHETADVDAAQRWWEAAVHAGPEWFGNPTIKRHIPTSRRRNTGDDYHGCLVVRVRRSLPEARRIAAMWAAISAHGLRLEERSAVG